MARKPKTKPKHKSTGITIAHLRLWFGTDWFGLWNVCQIIETLDDPPVNSFMPSDLWEELEVYVKAGAAEVQPDPAELEPRRWRLL